MDKGTKLVFKCSKIKCWIWNYCFKAYSYVGKLKELHDAIEKFCRVNSIVHNTRTGLETLTKLNLVLDMRKKYGVGSLPCVVPRPRDFIVGFDLHLKELKMMLFKKEVSLLLLAAPASCGKTTLVGMLCRDPEIKGTSSQLKLLASTIIKGYRVLFVFCFFFLVLLSANMSCD